jgi:large subunit ribosomal protein L35
MGYKLKPNKAVAKRFKVTATGKLKRYHSLTSHLRSARTSKKKRELRRPEMLYEGLARNMRRLMGVSKSPGKIATQRAARAAEAKAQTKTEAKAAQAG